MNVECLSALVQYSPNAKNLAQFYREILGIPLEQTSHGDVGEHYETFYKRTHYAIWQEEERQAANSQNTIVPTFLVRDIQGYVGLLSERGIKILHPIKDIGEGKKVVTILDPDGNRLRLIEIAHSR